MFGSLGRKQNKSKTNETVEDILMKQSPDRRLLPHMPGKQRSGKSRRAISDEEVKKYPYLKFYNGEDANVRYEVKYPVRISVGNSVVSYVAYASDISISGMKIHTSVDAAEEIVTHESVTLAFEIQPGTLPEGLEMKVKTDAHSPWPAKEVVVKKISDVRSGKLPADTEFAFGMQFEHNLLEYSNKHRARYELMTASFLLFMVCLAVMLMRTESVIYFKFNKYLYLYSIIASTFLLTKYAFGFFYKPVHADEHYTPGVSIIVPCFNEETWIRQTILNAMDQYYPQDKLEVIVVDDCSTDHSANVIRETINDIISQEGAEVAARISYILQPVNKGKREALALGAKHAQHELLVFVDSDSFLNPYAIINLVQPFKDAEVGGVSGRTDVANTYTNSLTKMQSVRYYIAFRIMKAAEGLFNAVSCLSGPLACYRKDLVLKYSDEWLNQKFLGQRATFGDDRAMTNLILRHNRTDYQDTAVCYTIVPNDYDVFLKQQMRWKRSWLRESLIAAGFMWKKEPFAAISFYMGLLVPIIAPFIVCYNLIYIPVTHRLFPTTFILGMILMALLMSACQALLRRSTTWLYGIWFCIYYELILLWQMPIAWFTFWKSTWGTRMTPADIAAQEREKKADKDAQPKVAGPAEEIVPAGTAGPGVAEPLTIAETAQTEAAVLPKTETAFPLPAEEKEPIAVPAIPVAGKPEEGAPSPADAVQTRTAEPAVQETKEEIRITVPAPETKAEELAAQPAAAETTESQAVQPAVTETAEIQPVAKEPVVETPAALKAEEDARKAEIEARQEERRRSFTDNVFNQEAVPYVDPRYAAGMPSHPYGRDIADDLAREQEALIELIRENQKQVRELHKLMEQRIELEKMRIATYYNARADYYKEESIRKEDASQPNQEEDKP